jgi:leucyl aminopeptidase
MTMKTSFSANPSAFETDCLAVVVLDRGEKDKPQVTVESSDSAVVEAAASVLSSGEVTGKMFETTLLHAPAKLKAKRLLLVGGGKAKSFSNADLRRVAGVAARTLKGKNIRSFAFVAPPNSQPAELAVRTIVEGLYIADFDSDTYKTDRKDQSLQTVNVLSAGDPV